MIYLYLKNKTAQIAKQNIIKYYFPDMNSEIILETFEKRLLMQRYAGNTIRSYKDYASIFLKHVSKYPSLEEIPLSDIEAFINEKVQNGKISVSYQKGLQPVVHEENYFYVVQVNAVQEAEPKTLAECKGRVINDYQQYLEENWVTNLKQEFNVTVNQSVFDSVKKQIKN